MKSFFVVCFCFVFLPIIIHGTDGGSEESERESEDDGFKKLKEKLHKMAENGEKINKVLQLTPEGYLGEGSYGLVFKGVRMSDSRPVAIKFIENDAGNSAEIEYCIYTYLNAVDKADVERFGIPAIYYYGRWDVCDDYTVMALSLFEESLHSKADKKELEKPLNNLIVFRQFVRQSKYLHSRGVRHDDIKSDNIMIRNYQSFLIDYNLSSKMENDTHLCTLRYKSRRCHRKHSRFAIDDWESFFYTMCFINGIDLKWFFTSEYDDLDDDELERQIDEDKSDIEDILSKVKAIESEPLRDVLMAFYNEIFGEQVKKFPDYNGIDQIITKQIEKLVPPNEPVFFTWMNENDTKAALEHMKEYRVPDIQNDIKEPSDIKFETFIYPEVDFEHFNKTLAGPSLSRRRLSSSISSSSSSRKRIRPNEIMDQIDCTPSD